MAEGLQTVYARELLNDEKMLKWGWPQLMKREVDVDALHEYDNRGLLSALELRDLDGFSVADQAAAILFREVVRIAVRGKLVVGRADLDRAADPYEQAADLCRWVKRHEYFPTGSLDSCVAQALDIVIEHCIGFADLVAQKESALILDRRGQVDDLMRTRILGVSSVIEKLYNKQLYGTVATIVNAVFSPDKKITKTFVRDVMISAKGGAKEIH